MSHRSLDVRLCFATMPLKKGLRVYWTPTDSRWARCKERWVPAGTYSDVRASCATTSQRHGMLRVRHAAVQACGTLSCSGCTSDRAAAADFWVAVEQPNTLVKTRRCCAGPSPQRATLKADAPQPYNSRAVAVDQCSVSAQQQNKRYVLVKENRTAQNQR